MEGIKEFINNACEDLNVTITVRSGDQPGCVFRIEEFCLKRYECKKVVYGDKCNPFLDGICACYCDIGQYAETNLRVKKCGCPLDRLINTHKRIIFLNAGPNIVITASDF